MDLLIAVTMGYLSHHPEYIYGVGTVLCCLSDVEEIDFSKVVLCVDISSYQIRKYTIIDLQKLHNYYQTNY